MPTGNQRPELKSTNQRLTDKEKVFVEWYLILWNAAKAAAKAGYCLENPSNQRIAGFEILSKPYIKAAINERMVSVCMDANEVLARLAAIGSADYTDFMVQDDAGEWYVDVGLIKTAGLGFLIKSVEPNRLGGHTKVEFYSAMDALDRIAKHLNLLKQPETEVNVSLSAWSIFVQQAKDQQASLPKTANPMFIGSPTQRALTNALQAASGDPDADVKFIDTKFNEPKDGEQ